MDSKVQKAVHSVIDQLLTKLEDQCGASKDKLWELWKEMFYENSEPKKRVVKRKTAEKSFVVKEVADEAPPSKKQTTPPKTEVLASPPMPQVATVAPSSTSPVATASPQATVSTPPIESHPIPLEEDVDMSDSHPAQSDGMDVESNSLKLEEEEDMVPEPVVVPQKIAPVFLPPQKSPPKEQEEVDGCVFILVKGPEKGRKCGKKIGLQYKDVKLCPVHGKKA